MSRYLWHRWNETIEGDEECGTCHVVVSPESMQAFTLPCPTPDCRNGANPDRGCLMAPSRTHAAACIYCGRPGGRRLDPDTDGDPVGEHAPGDLVDELDE